MRLRRVAKDRSPFRALHLSPQILQAVRDSGYTEPTTIQIAAIPLILAGHDVIGIAQTGTGKTAAFVLPILMKLAESRQTVARHGELTPNRRDQKHNVHRLRALVLAPTRELVVQIEENVRAYGKHVPLRVATVFGGVSERPQIEALRSGVDMIVATPGRLIDLMEQRAMLLFNGIRDKNCLLLAAQIPFKLLDHLFWFGKKALEGSAQSGLIPESFAQDHVTNA